MTNAIASRALLLASMFTVVCAGCAGTQFARLNNAQRIPAGGPGPNPAGMPLQTMATAEWAQASKTHLEPVCDARSKKVQAEPLKDAKRVVEMWAEFVKAHPKKPVNNGGVTLGQLTGMAPPTGRRIDSLNVTCDPAAPFVLEVNGVKHTFDMLWAVSSVGTRASFQALSLRENMLVFAEVTVPATPKGEPQETVLAANISNYIPDNAQDPIVRNTTQAQGSALFETLVVGKGKTDGFYWLAPRSSDFGADRFAEAGRFRVGD